MIVLHCKDFAMQPPGGELRKCTKCGVRLWIPSDGEWTDEVSIWESPPAEFVNCRDARGTNG